MKCSVNKLITKKINHMHKLSYAINSQDPLPAGLTQDDLSTVIYTDASFGADIEKDYSAIFGKPSLPTWR